MPAPTLKIEAPAEGSNVRGTVEVRTIADPEKGSHVVTTERRIAGGAWTAIGTDDSSPAYTVFDDLTSLNLAAGTTVEYRATLTEPNGTLVTSPVRTVKSAGLPATSIQLRYYRPAGDYGDPPAGGWGLHMWGDAVAPAVLAQIAWDRPWPRATIENGWAVFNIPLVDDTKPVNFIMHLPSGNAVPATREPGGDRSFWPIDYLQKGAFLVQGDPTVYSSPPAL